MKTKTWLVQIWTVLCMAGLAQLAWAEARSFAPGTQRGVLDLSGYPDLRIDGKLKQALPTLRIYTEANLLVLPVNLERRQYYVHYLQNDFGELEKVWLVTPEELTISLPKVEAFVPRPFKNPN